MNYPEHEKLKALEGDNQTCGLFLEWLLDKYTLSKPHSHSKQCYDEDDLDCGLHDAEIVPISISVQKILAEYFEIDLKKLDAEKEQMLKEIRDAQTKTA